jgi:mono/diheme cytochrome c family protein
MTTVRLFLILTAVLMIVLAIVLPTHKTLADEKEPPAQHQESKIPVMPLQQTPPAYMVPPTGYVPPAVTPIAKEGKALYQAMNCANCHSVAGSGGNLGPPLDGVGGRRSEEYLMAHLTDPAEHAKKYPHLHPLPTMPHPHATAEEVKALVSYLVTLPEPKAGFLIQAHPAAAAAAAASERPLNASQPTAATTTEGRKLFLDHGCAACHSIGGSGSSFGPKLDNASRLGRAYIESMIMRRGKGGSVMSWRNVSSEDASKIADFLMTLR